VQLSALGWNDGFTAAFEPHRSKGLIPARVAVEHRSRYLLYAERDELTAVLAGRLRFNPGNDETHPVVGDWVAVALPDGDGPAVIHAVLPRATKFTRRAPMRDDIEQVLAANIDRVLVVVAADRDANPRRLERYLAMAWDGGAEPVVVLSKCDLEGAHDRRQELEAVAFGVDVIAVSNVTGVGVDEVRALLSEGITVALLGSSGVGKSSLVNSLLGHDQLRTGTVRDDGKGRHTTTHRELVLLPSGGLLLDTPGMRELGLWEANEGTREAFADITALAEQCRFGDCRHESEPGCAVLDAVANGVISPERLRNWRKLIAELEYLERRNDARARTEESRQGAIGAKALRARLRDKYK
jgi:ribosome biogenesis GTPase / thiamine phosphate phosphatase